MELNTELLQNSRGEWIALYAGKITSAYKALSHSNTGLHNKVVFYFNCLVEKCFNPVIDDESLSALKKDLELALKNIPLSLSNVERNEVCRIINRISKGDLYNQMTVDDKNCC